MIFGRSDYAPDAGTELGAMGITITAAGGIIAQPPAKPTQFKNITDGASHTILIVEDAGRPAFYGSQGRISRSEPARGRCLGRPAQLHRHQRLAGRWLRLRAPAPAP